MNIKRLFVASTVLGFVLLIFIQPAWSWGPHTHAFFGWVAAQQLDPCPGTEFEFFPHSNNQPDISHYTTSYGYCHGDQRFPRITLDSIARNIEERGYALGWAAHQIEDYWGHTFYVPRDQFKHFIAEISVDCVIYNSPDPAERDFARTITVAWNSPLTRETSLEYTSLYGGEPIPESEWDVLGCLFAKVIAAEKALIGNRLFYFYARARFPRTDWQVFLDNSIAELATWCQNGGGSDEFDTGSSRQTDETMTGWPKPLEEYLIRLSDHLTGHGAMQISINKHEKNIKPDIYLANRPYVDKIMQEFFTSQFENPKSVEDKLYSEIFLLLTTPYDSSDQEFDRVLDHLIKTSKAPKKLLLNFDPVR